MTIAKGEAWGMPHDGEPPANVAESDAELARYVFGRLESDRPPVAGVVAGDLAATIGLGVEATSGSAPGAGSARVQDRPVIAYPVDLGIVELGSKAGQPQRTVPFVANVIGRRRPWSWPELIVMNAQLAAGRRFGPRAHPNDGLLDVITGALPWRQGREAMRRSLTASHLPHPGLEVLRTREFETTVDSPLDIRVDGITHGRWRWIRTKIVPDAFLLVVGAPGPE